MEPGGRGLAEGSGSRFRVRVREVAGLTSWKWRRHTSSGTGHPVSAFTLLSSCHCDLVLFLMSRCISLFAGFMGPFSGLLPSLALRRRP